MNSGTSIIRMFVRLYQIIIVCQYLRLIRIIMYIYIYIYYCRRPSFWIYLRFIRSLSCEFFYIRNYMCLSIVYVSRFRIRCLIHYIVLRSRYVMYEKRLLRNILIVNKWYRNSINIYIYISLLGAELFENPFNSIQRSIHDDERFGEDINIDSFIHHYWNKFNKCSCIYIYTYISICIYIRWSWSCIWCSSDSSREFPSYRE